MPQPRVVANFSDLLSHLAAAQEGGAQVVGIDGASKSGKSETAHRVAKALGWRHVRLDRFCQAGAGSYLAGVRLGALRGAIELEFSSAPTIVVEGICLRDVLGAVGLAPDLGVYCTREPPGEIPRPESGDPSRQAIVDRWYAEYHDRVRPDRLCDIVFDRRAEERDEVFRLMEQADP